MQQQLSKWLKYMQNLRCDTALAKCQAKNINVDYGEEVYVSPLVNGARWLVTEFHDEYNVFVENLALGHRTNRVWGACFKGKERAMTFALRMTLVYSGKIHRMDWRKNEHE